MMLRHVLRAGRSSALRRSSPLCLRLSPAASPSPAATAAIAPSFSSTSSASASTASRAGGQVYAWGRAKNGSVGLGPEVTDIVGLPNRVAVLAGEDIVRVRCFEDTSGALTAGGDLFLWGDNDAGKISPDGEKKFYPFKVDGLDGINVVDFAIGSKHALVLDDAGSVFSWGWGGSFFGGAGALGHGDKTSYAEPTLIQMFEDEGIKIKQIASGGKHAVALDDEGMVWTWGAGEFGRLGHGGASDLTEPEPLEFFEEAGACSLVRAGSSYCAALTTAENGGQLYTWGKNNDGQLGIGNPLSMGFAMETFPRRVEEGLPKDDPIVEVVTGATHMLMLTASGKVFTAGMKIFNVPKAITFEGDTQPVVTRIGAGKNISAAITEEGHAYSWCKGRLQGQFIGHGPQRYLSGMEKHPKRIEEFDNIGRVLDIACGGKHMLAIVEEA